MGTLKDMFYMGENRFIVILCLSGETDNVYGYFHPKANEAIALEHYNKIRRRQDVEKSGDSVLYLDNCKVVENPNLDPETVCSYLKDKMEIMSIEELEAVIQEAARELEIKKLNRKEEED